MAKKAQATIFAIIGIILLIGGGVFMYSQTQATKQLIPEVYIKGGQVPIEFMGIKQYVDECVYKTSVEGLKLAGQHGGYISMVDPEISTISFNILPEATESDAVIFSSGSNLAIPYWWYLQSVNDCTGTCRFSSKRPNLRDSENSVEKQLERYVKKNLKACLDDFNDFREQGFGVEETGDLKVDVIIAEKDVAVLVDYPIEASREAKSEITKYYALVPINLERVYNLATEITNLQKEHRFLENSIVNLIASFASVDKEKLPPVSDLRFSYGSTLRWSKQDVKNKIVGILTSYIDIFQVDGTSNFERNLFGDLLKQRLYDAFIVPPVDMEYQDLSAEFSYLDFWPIYFDLNCNGDICEPESASSPFLSYIGIQRYNFMYDVSYPVLVEVREPNALNGQGFDFRFFLEANLRNNEAVPVDYVPLEAAEIPHGTYLCDYEQRQSGDVEVTVLNKMDKKPVEEARVAYSVAGETCYIGSTDAEGILKAKFPIGSAGGIVTILKEEHLSKSRLFDAGTEEKSLEVEIDPILEKKVVVKKKKLVKAGDSWNFVDKVVELEEEEQAVLTLTRIGGMEEQEYSTAVEFTGNQTEPGTIDVAPGDYKATINLLLYKDLVIPPKHISKDGGWFGEDVEYDLPGETFSKDKPYLSGGLSMNITLTSRELQKYNTIVFYAISQDLEGVPEQSRDINDLQQIAKYGQYSNVYSTLLEPTFENR